ncbi:PTS sugar transporter subunit IIA [Streptococcus chenjunshii]|uniref:PTS sugar transporter subunit IIA n=1 Tax=Streptococcus chenjunshii TaxID=2173853 RepID=A0A372KKH0_9STRE|nr:fructose PTS transporter subunit IIA [Streptococcus chenjunshii]AXQ79274.1 PTS sugar transporter subunit IIA [Streptococcus chenjunshii]RFU50545.1 PTS sugar transporter subunit IIA [Streptococcus chenjunshii]RFU52404.1 PTS sugar transporter subunit IIA [Streptococcus chenjunshii]
MTENKNVISKDLIFLDSDLTDQNAIIHYLVDKAQSADYIEDADDFFTKVKEREKEVPTAIGYSVAIPHGKSDTVLSPFIAFLRLKDDVKWSGKNEDMVRLVFLIGVPEQSEGKLHLKFISELSKKLLDEEFRQKLLEQSTVDAAFAQLNAVEL